MMTDATAKPVGTRIGNQAWLYLVYALLAFVFGSLAINMVAGRLGNSLPVERGFAVGAMETVTPVTLAPWWLGSRPQLDCQLYMPFLSRQVDAVAAISRPRFVLADRRTNACSLLASISERKRLSGNMREVSRRDGFQTAGSVSLPALALLGIPLTRWINVAFMALAAVAGLWVMFTDRSEDERRVRLAAAISALATGAILLPVLGSLTAMPTLAIVFAAMFFFLYLLGKNRADIQTVFKIVPLMAVALTSLDPTGGSAVVGFGCVLLLARLGRPRGDRGTYMLLTGGYYGLTVILCWLVYALCVGLADGWPDGGRVLAKYAFDLAQAGQVGELQAAAVGTFRWLSSPSLLGPLGATNLILAILFGLAASSAVKPLATMPRFEPFGTAMAAILPITLWALLYPGFLRSAEDQYVLLLLWLFAIAASGPLCLIVEGIRRLIAGRKSVAAPSALLQASPLA